MQPPDPRAAGDTVSRRAMLGVSSAATAAFLAACSANSAVSDEPGPPERQPGPSTSAGTTTTTTTPISPTSEPLTLFTQSDLNFQALFALGGTPYGAGEVGEVNATVERINAAGASYQTFFDEFMAAGGRLAERAAAAEADGHVVTARAAHRRAAQYYNQALFFVLGTSTPDREQSVYETMQAQWDAASQLETPPFEQVQIPYEGGALNGYFLQARGVTGPRPIVIVQNGSDAQNVDVWSFGGAAAIERGYHALFFDGPGQGGELFIRKVPFRTDWENVITPVVDFVTARPDVDPARVALSGWSLSGSLVVRAAAFEQRLAAVIADPGAYSPWLAWPEFLRALFDNNATQEQVNQAWAGIVPGIPPEQQFDIKKRSEIFGTQFLEDARRGEVLTDFWTLGQTLMQFDITEYIADVTCPVLVTGYEQDTLLPGQDQQVFDLLRSPKEQHQFTAADGAQLHDAPMAAQVRNEVVYDWLDDTLA